ncbi:phage antirepressor N-terminal domain-containing protein [Kurthia senegalensis]|uniref:phage antirepressor N-terminal domain-containing protein n=1 Tax=Kurthia senegalensis TaxID=1033740 RepID=UPI0002887B9F|nr:phage antirepressor N-terminal domain-containing protein [Kurthia senegalensis]
MTNVQVIEQQTVSFAGTELLAAKSTNGKIYVAVKWVSEGVGLSEGQYQNQTRKIQGDLVLFKGIANLQLPTKGGLQDVLCIELDFLPLWLAKINITPKMQEETPWVANRLIEYQLKAKDVLAEAFLQKQKPLTQAEMFMQAAQQMLAMEQEVTAIKQRTDVLEQNQQNIAEIMALNASSWRKTLNTVLNRIADVRGGLDQYQAVRRESYELLEQRGKCKLEIRVNNRKRDMAAVGLGKSKVKTVSKLDVISSDQRLLEIYIAIVKEMAIKHNVKFQEVLV